MTYLSRLQLSLLRGSQHSRSIAVSATIPVLFSHGTRRYGVPLWRTGTFWVTVRKTVPLPVLSDRCLSVCPICNGGVLWPNDWAHQDETWYRSMSRARRHCVWWGSSSSSLKGHSPQFLAHVCCGQTAGWIKMPLGREVGLGPGEIVLNGNPAPPLKGAQPPLFDLSVLWPKGWMGKDATWYEGRPRRRPHCVRWGPSSPQKGHNPLPPIYGSCRLWPNGRPYQLLLSTCFMLQVQM